MERKSHENFYDKGTYTYYEIANMAKSKTSIDHPSVSFSKRDEEVKIHQINGCRPSKACIVHSDDFSLANRGLSPSPETVKACDDLSPRPSTLNQSTGRQEVFEVPVTIDDHHNLHYNNTQDDATCLIDPIKHQQNATPTLTERIIPYKLIALSFVVGIVIASLIVIPVIVISINKDTNNNDVTRCSDDTWSKWSECSTSCGQGFQKRMKGCSNGIDNTESRQCANKSCEIGTSGSCHFDLILDQSTRHALCYLSTDNHVVSNYDSLETPVRPQSVHHLEKFQGVIGKPCIEPGWIVYYEIGYSYKIISNVFINMTQRQNKHVEMVLDFGLAAKDHVDDHHHIGNNDQELAFSMYLCRSSNNICFAVINNGLGIMVHQLSDIVLGTSQNGSFGIFVNRLRQEISLIDIQQENILYRFSYVKTDKDLCPVFGAGYNARAVESSITLLYSRLLFQQLNDSITFCKGSIFDVLKGLL